MFCSKEKALARCVHQLRCMWFLGPTGRCVILCIVQLIAIQNAFVLDQLVRTEEGTEQRLEGNGAEILKVDSQKARHGPVRTLLT